MTSGKPENPVYPLMKNGQRTQEWYAPRIVRAMPARNKTPHLGQVALVKEHTGVVGVEETHLTTHQNHQVLMLGAGGRDGLHDCPDTLDETTDCHVNREPISLAHMTMSSRIHLV